MTEGDAFLVYLGIYGFERARDSAGDEMKTDVRKIWDEITISAQDEQVVMVMEPKPEEDNSLFSALLRPRRLKAAFLYNRDVSSSGWTYWHDMGRRYVDDVMEGRVETRTALATTEDEAFSALEDMAEDGVDVVFTTSPLFLSSAIRQSVRHTGMKILNC